MADSLLVGLSTAERQDIVAALVASIQTVLADVRAEIADTAYNFPPRALQYARDANDRMRTVIDSGTTDVTAVRMWNNGTLNAWYTAGGPNSMDQRETQREVSVQTFYQSTRNRWTVS